MQPLICSLSLHYFGALHRRISNQELAGVGGMDEGRDDDYAALSLCGPHYNKVHRQTYSIETVA